MMSGSLQVSGGYRLPSIQVASDSEKPGRPGAGSGIHGEAGAATQRRIRVLIVEDDADARELYAWCMRAVGWTAMTAADGNEALKLARMLEPDVIVMDLALPVMDGFETTRRLKADEHTRHIPIVGCTAYVRSEPQALEAGCDVFLTKPCEPEAIRRTVEAIIAARGPRGSSA